MAALVQGYPQQSGTVTMLQTRPSSASGMLQTVPVQPNGQYLPRNSQRNSVHGLPATVVTAPVVYRGGAGPVQPYAFTSTPSLNPTTQWQQYRTLRTSSSPAVPTIQSLDYLQPAVARSRYSASLSMTNLPSTANTGSQNIGAGYRDDSALPTPSTGRTTTPRSSHLNGTPIQPSLAPTTQTRAPPERYRRSVLRTDSAGPSSGQPQQEATPAPSTTASRKVPDQKVSPMLRPPSHSSQLNRPNSIVGSLPVADDTNLPLTQSENEIKRVRRRSVPAWDSPGFSLHLTPHGLEQSEEPNRPKSADNRDNTSKPGNDLAVDKTSKDAQTASASGRNTGASANRNDNISAPPTNPTSNTTHPDNAGTSPDHPRLVTIPPRGSSSDAANAKRIANPSPLSKPMTMGTGGESGQATDATDPAVQETATAPRFESPAVRRLAAINDKGGKPKSKTSRLRRAFSFGSASEFRKAAHDGDAADNAQSKLHKERNPDDAYDEEQARIAQRQEAAGIGSNIYAGGRFFHGSTDNLSISSTASSASIMIRKMGRGMKKSTRSLVGLFRPKSVIGVPSADAMQPDISQTAVSMVTVEAERELVNVNPDPRAQNGGGTGFPRLERNSIDTARVNTSEPDRVGSSGTDDSTAARKSIVGGEKERAEILAAVRKGILKKRSGSSSPSPRPSESKGSALDLPGLPQVSDSPNSSAPSTPNEESQGLRRTGGVTIGSEDYFVTALRLRQDSKSSPTTPQGSLKRNATFSPRIVFFETWPSGEYDRRGEVATCNRLTPMLAQQIKEELNTFKMEMEVHENSKIYTHFF